MKKNAGPLKLQLAQFRELESFAQFSSDLDPETKKTIDHGRKLVEVLKQPQSAPVSVAKQVAILYAVNNDYLNDVENDALPEWEADFYAFLDASKSDLLEKLGKGWGEDEEKALGGAIEEFKKNR